jgi:hypothetical protein
MIQLITCNLAVLVIAGVYYSWRDRVTKAEHQRRELRERVTYMLWSAAQRI